MKTVALGAVAVVLVALVAGCERPTGFRERDILGEVRQAGPPPPTTTQVTSPADTDLARQQARQQAAQGFIRRGTPRQPVLDDTPGAAPPVGGSEITLDLDGADLEAVIQVIMQDGLQANYILDPQVSGTVTLRTNRPLAPEELLPTLQEILRLNNAALIERDGTYRIVPSEQVGLAAPLLSFRDVRARGLTVRVTPLRFVRVEEIAEVLDSFAPASGSIRYDRRSNLVFSVASPAEQRTIGNLIASLDINDFIGRSFALRPLQEAEPSQVALEMEAIFGGPSGNPNTAIQFLPIDRIDAVLIITDEASLLDEALGVVTSLDQGLGDNFRLHVYSVKNRRASELAQILGAIFGADVQGARPQTSALPAGQETDLQTTGDQAPEAAQSAGVATVSGAAGGAGQSGVLQIVADEASNSLVALANGDGAKALRGALRRLDVQPLQVMIEATLVEVVLNDTLEYGVRWFFQSGNFEIGVGPILATGANALVPGFNSSFVTDDITVTLRALDAVTDIQVLSAPTLMVLDNQPARLTVGDEVPVATGSSEGDSEDSLTLTDFEYRDTGVILDIRPSVNAGGLVVLDIRQEVRDVVDTVGTDNPTFSQRVIESTIAVQNGQTVALAGLIEEESGFGRDGIPILSRIPVLGSAFGTTTEVNNRTELLVLIRPVVVRDQGAAYAATEELRRKLISLAGRAPQDPLTSLQSP